MQRPTDIVDLQALGRRRPKKCFDPTIAISPVAVASIVNSSGLYWRLSRISPMTAAIIKIKTVRLPKAVACKPASRGDAGPIEMAGVVDATETEQHSVVEAIRASFLYPITDQTVTAWRNALQISSRTIGRRKLQSAYGSQPEFRHVLEAAHATLKDAARGAKIPAALKGQPKPKHILEMLFADHWIARCPRRLGKK